MSRSMVKKALEILDDDFQPKTEKNKKKKKKSTTLNKDEDIKKQIGRNCSILKRLSKPVVSSNQIEQLNNYRFGDTSKRNSQIKKKEEEIFTQEDFDRFAREYNPPIKPDISSDKMETPKRKNFAESLGGLAFEVKLEESPRNGSSSVPIHFLSPSTKHNQNDLTTPLTPEIITEKLKRAEGRRISLEQLRSTLLAAENSRPNEISKIKDQQAEEFKKMTEEKLLKKLESAKENRERVLQAKVEKAKGPIEKGFATIQQNLAKLEEERQLLQEKINQKLEAAETNRQEHLDRLMEKLSEHDKKIEMIKSQTKLEMINTQ